jgi:hypothetical protein
MSETRAEQAGTCAAPDGQHDWLDVTILTDCGRVARYACGQCRAEAEEPFVQADMPQDMKPVQTFHTLPREKQLAIIGQREWTLRMDVTEESPLPDVIVLNGIRYTPERIQQ